MWPSTPAVRRHLAQRCRTCCLRRFRASRPPQNSSFRGSIPHPIRSLCTLRTRRRRRLRNTRFPAARYHLTGADLSPAETRQLRLLARNRKFESISLQRRVFANLTRSIRSPKILPSELRAASVIRVYIARAVSWRGPDGEVRRLTDDRLVLRRAFADQIADDHQPGGDPDARLELSRFDIQPTDRVDQAEPARTARSARHRPHALAGSRNRPAHHRPVFASGAVCGSWFERAFARGNHQIVFEFHQPQEQWNHSRLFDEADRFVGGYPGQLPFALFGPFLKALLDPKEINLDCRSTNLARF